MGRLGYNVIKEVEKDRLGIWVNTVGEGKDKLKQGYHKLQAMAIGRHKAYLKYLYAKTIIPFFVQAYIFSFFVCLPNQLSNFQNQ